MENFSIHAPFFVATNGVASSGHSSDLAGGQIGLFDRQNFSIATVSGLAKELFLAQGAIGGKDWYGNPVTDSHKSPFFLAKDVKNMYKSLPAKIQNEEWIVGFDGSASSKSLEFAKGIPFHLKMYFHGEPVYRMFNAPKEYVVSYSAPVNCTTDCASGCDADRMDPKPHAMKLIDQINKHVELKKLGVKAMLVESTFSAAATTKEKFLLTIFDEGTGVSLAQVKAQYPGKDIKVISREGVKTIYALYELTSDADPSAFQYKGSSLSLSACGTCPSGFTLVAGTKTYYITRPLAGTEDFTTTNLQQTFANSVKTAYSLTGVATYVGNNGATAFVKIIVADTVSVTAILADTVSLEGQVAAQCQSGAGATQAWVADGNGIAGERTLKIKLQRPDCDSNGDRLADITAALTGVANINIGTLTKIAGTGCFDEYTVTQGSDDYLDEGCLTSNASFTFSNPLSLLDGKAWEVLDPVITPDNTRKVGIRISAGYYDPKFGQCSFDPTDYYENMPIKMEVSAMNEDANNCEFAALPTQVQTKIAKIARQSGEWVLREVIMKTEAYLQHVDQWSAQPRMREAFDMQIQNSVDRNAFYILWYVTFYANYNQTSRKNEKEQFTAVIAFKENDAKLADFETKVIDVIVGKSGLDYHINK